MRKAIIPLATVFYFAVSAFALTGQEIAKRAYEASEADGDNIEDFTCKLTHVVADEDGDEMVRMVGNLYHKEPDMDYFEILEYYEDGKKEDIPDDDEDDEEMEIKFPFEDDYFDDYDYKYKRTETFSGKECYVVGVTGKKKTEGYIKGTAWFETGSYEIVKMYGELYKQPKKMISESNMTMYFKEYDGHIVPSKVKFYAKATFLLFINKKIYMTQDFSDYRFNTGLSDSLFE